MSQMRSFKPHQSKKVSKMQIKRFTPKEKRTTEIKQKTTFIC
jgi:hypothetical protein